jgi:hypothetical protein
MPSSKVSSVGSEGTGSSTTGSSGSSTTGSSGSSTTGSSGSSTTVLWLFDDRLLWLFDDRLLWLFDDRLLWLFDDRLFWLFDDRLFDNRIFVDRRFVHVVVRPRLVESVEKEEVEDHGIKKVFTEIKLIHEPVSIGSFPPEIVRRNSRLLYGKNAFKTPDSLATGHTLSQTVGEVTSIKECQTLKFGVLQMSFILNDFADSHKLRAIRG